MARLEAGRVEGDGCDSRGLHPGRHAAGVWDVPSRSRNVLAGTAGIGLAEYLSNSEWIYAEHKGCTRFRVARSGRRILGRNMGTRRDSASGYGQRVQGKSLGVRRGDGRDGDRCSGCRESRQADPMDGWVCGRVGVIPIRYPTGREHVRWSQFSGHRACHHGSLLGGPGRVRPIWTAEETSMSRCDTRPSI